MTTPIVPYPVQLFADDDNAEDVCCKKFVELPKYFDPNLLFFGAGDGPLKLCQKLLETVVNSSSYLAVRPSISVLSLIPSVVEELPCTMRGQQLVAFGKKYNWKLDDVEGAFFVTNYDSLRLDGIKKKKEFSVEDFLQCRKIPRAQLHGVIFQQKEPLWLSGIRSAEMFNFKKRLADVLNVSSNKIFWVQTDKDLTQLLSVTMRNVYRWREDRQSEVRPLKIAFKISFSIGKKFGEM